MKASEAIRFRKSFYLPKYWGIWLWVGILRLIGFLPYKTKFRFGAWVGRVLYHLAKKRRRIALANVGLAFPEKSEFERTAIVKQNFESMGISFMEMTITWWGDHRRNFENAKERAYFSYKGLEHVENLKQEGVGALFLTPHFTHIEMTGLIAAYHADLYSVYKPHKNPLIDHLILKGRTLGPNQCLPIDYHDTRTLIKSLKQGRYIGYLPDQRYRGKGHLNVPFFGRIAQSHSATSKLAQLTGCKVIPLFTRRQGCYYEVEFMPPLENFPSGDDFADTLRLHQLYEQEIRQNPTQYLWVHNRWDLKFDSNGQIIES
jgi:KDO2-lipid IV(A) lauroyltransferase